MDLPHLLAIILKFGKNDNFENEYLISLDETLEFTHVNGEVVKFEKYSMNPCVSFKYTEDGVEKLAYHTYALIKIKNRWFRIDNSEVSYPGEVSTANIRHNAIIFYKKVDAETSDDPIEILDAPTIAVPKEYKALVYSLAQATFEKQ